jgi:hypothetical protein
VSDFADTADLKNLVVEFDRGRLEEQRSIFALSMKATNSKNVALPIPANCLSFILINLSALSFQLILSLIH